MMKGNGIFVLRDGPIKEPKYLTGKLIVTHQGSHAVHRYLEQIAQANPKAMAIDPAGLVYSATVKDVVQSGFTDRLYGGQK